MAKKKSEILKEATDTKGNPIHVGDKVAFVAYLWDPLLCVGEITNIYAPVEEPDDRARMWTTKCSVKDLSNGQIVPNVQIRRILKLQDQNVQERKGQQYQLLRECKYGVDSIYSFAAESYEDAVKHAQMVALIALGEAYDDDPDEVWGDDVYLYSNPNYSNDIACGIDPEDVSGYIRSDVYLSVARVENVEPSADPVEITAENEALLKIARDANDLEQDLKLAFRLKKAGCTYAEISEVFHDEKSEFWAEMLELLDEDSTATVCLYDSMAAFGRESFSLHNLGSLDGYPDSPDDWTDEEAESEASTELECLASADKTFCNYEFSSKRFIFAEID